MHCVTQRAGDRLVTANDRDTQIALTDDTARRSTEPLEITEERGGVQVKFRRKRRSLRDGRRVVLRAKCFERVARIRGEHVHNKRRDKQHRERRRESTSDKTKHALPAYNRIVVR